jgi:hypothetical protein
MGQVGTSFFFSFYDFFMAFLCVSQQGSSKTPQTKIGGNPCQKPLAEKAEKKTFFLSSFPIDSFFIAFLAVSLHVEPKNTIKTFSKLRPENLKKSPKK